MGELGVTHELYLTALAQAEEPGGPGPAAIATIAVMASAAFLVSMVFFIKYVFNRGRFSSDFAYSPLSDESPDRRDEASATGVADPLPTSLARVNEDAGSIEPASSGSVTGWPKHHVNQTQGDVAKTGGFGIFISYRRQDEPNFAGRLYDRLATKFDRASIFMDVDSIELGLDFADVINRSLARCEAMIVIMGREWLNVQDSRGRQRLSNSNDYVRLEIESALKRNIRVIPVLVEGATVPDGDELPDSLESLSRRNGIEMSHARFNSDADRLIETLERVLGRDA